MRKKLFEQTKKITELGDGDPAGFQGIEEFEWFDVMESHFNRISADASSILTNVRATFGAAFLFVGLSICWLPVLAYRVFAYENLNLSQSLALLAPIVIFLTTAGFLLRNSLRARNEFTLARLELNELQLMIAKGVASMHSKSDFSKFVSGLSNEKVSEGQLKSDGETEVGPGGVSPRVVASIISAMGRATS